MIPEALAFLVLIFLDAAAFLSDGGVVEVLVTAVVILDAAVASGSGTLEMPRVGKELLKGR
jgi:hypothetical protein